jgi:cell division protein FtsW (lipid II flippase)
MSLKIAEFLVGLVLVCCGSSLVFRTKSCERLLRKFLRSEIASTMTFSLGGIWFLGHVLTLGESDFGEYKYLFFVFFLTVILVALVKIRDFLSVRGAAVLALLAANELLKAAYMEPYTSRLILVTFVYAMIVAGMTFGGWPYKGRDFINFLFAHPTRPGLLGLLTTSYGILTLTTLFW